MYKQESEIEGTVKTSATGVIWIYSPCHLKNLDDLFVCIRFVPK